MKLIRVLYPLAIITIFILAVVPNYRYMPEVFSLSDKLNHVAAFFVLSLLAYGSRYPHPFRYQLAFLGFYALFIECVQYFLPNRFFSLSDIVADLLGLGFMMLLRGRLDAYMGAARV